MKKEWEEWEWLNIIASRLVTRMPVLIKHVCLTSKSTGPAVVNIRNGVHVTAPIAISLSAIGDTHFTDDFEIPIRLEGLYVEVSGAYVAGCLIQFKRV